MDTERFIPFIKDYYRTKFNVTLDDSLFQTWIFGQGLPDNCPVPKSSRFEKVDAVLDSWKESGTLTDSLSKDWSTHEWLHFIGSLPDTLTEHQMTTLDKFGNFTGSGNAEVITAWGVVAIRNQYVKMYPTIESFLIHTGRRKFLMPLFTELMKTEEGKKKALEIYKEARPGYHFVAVNSLDKLLNYR